MPFSLRSRWLNLLHTLWFVPSAVSAAYIVLAAVLVRERSLALVEAIRGQPTLAPSSSRRC